MDYFRNIILVAAIAGIVAGIGKTVAHHYVTLTMIMKTEVLAQQCTAPEAPAT